MDRATFFQHFDLLADTPDAVAKMRELVLQLAATGHLVPRQSTWQQHKLKSLTSKIGSGATPSGGRTTYLAEGIPLIRSMNVHFQGFDHTGLAFLSDQQAAVLSNVVVQAHDVLLNITGASIGRVTITPPEMAGARVNQHVMIIRPTQELLPRFLQMLLAGPAFQQRINEIQVGATRQALTKSKVEDFDISLPLVSEQKRIVAKVEELLGLCDELEARQQQRAAARDALSAAACTHLAAAQDQPTFHKHAHFLLNNAPLVLDDVPRLRQTILQLAVQGRLVPQDPREGTGAEIVKRLSLRNLPDPSGILNEAFPSNWAVTALANLARIRSGVTKGRNLIGRDVASFPYLRVANVQRGYLDLELLKDIQIPIEEFDKFRLDPNDLLVTEGGDWDKVGRTAVWHGEIADCIHQNHVFRARLVGNELAADWFALYLNSPLGRQYFMAAAKQTTNLASINATELRSCPVPVPPPAEQQRIIAKVDELLRLCDELEALLKQSRTSGANLLVASIAHGLLAVPMHQRSQ